MTLKYEMQLFDELPMLWGSLMLVYCILTLLYPSIDKSLVYSLVTKLALISYGITSTLLYLCFKTPLLFQVSYGFLVTLMLYFDICIAKYKPCDRRIFYWAAIFYYSGIGVSDADLEFNRIVVQVSPCGTSTTYSATN